MEFVKGFRTQGQFPLGSGESYAVCRCIAVPPSLFRFSPSGAPFKRTNSCNISEVILWTAESFCSRNRSQEASIEEVSVESMQEELVACFTLGSKSQ
jgi:hypothetical protein